MSTKMILLSLSIFASFTLSADTEQNRLDEIKQQNQKLIEKENEEKLYQKKQLQKQEDEKRYQQKKLDEQRQRRV